MPPKVPTSPAQHLCTYCSYYWVSLNSHWGQSKCGEQQRLDKSKKYASMLAMRSASQSTSGSAPAYMDPLTFQAPMTPERAIPSKRTRVLSPDRSGQHQDYVMDDPFSNNYESFSESANCEDCGRESTPGNDTQTQGLKIFEVQPFPDVSTTTHGTTETIFQCLKREQIHPDLPAYPFKDEAEWSLVEWLGTSGISNNQIDSFLKSKWVIISKSLHAFRC